MWYLVIFAILLIYTNRCTEGLAQYRELSADNPDNEYHTDRDGRKGALFNTYPNKPMFEPTPRVERPLEPFQVITKRLELYPTEIYQACESSYTQAELDFVPEYPNDNDTYLQFNQGVLFT